MNRRRTLFVVLLSVAPLWLLSCSSNSSNPTNPGPGSGELNGSLGSTGSHYAHVFAKKGTFNYKCTIHPSCTTLAGTIVVVDSGTVIVNHVLAIQQTGGSTGPYGSSCSSLSLQRDTVLVGEQITWTNNSPLPHTVTSQ
jgi:hypothetical protein